MKLLIMQCSPFPCYLIPLRPKYCQEKFCYQFENKSTHLMLQIINPLNTKINQKFGICLTNIVCPLRYNDQSVNCVQGNQVDYKNHTKHMVILFGKKFRFLKCSSCWYTYLPLDFKRVYELAASGRCYCQRITHSFLFQPAPAIIPQQHFD